MKIILSREDVEEAIKMWVRSEVLPYGDTREIHVVQERKVTANVTFGDEKPDLTQPLPGLEEASLAAEEE